MQIENGYTITEKGKITKSYLGVKRVNINLAPIISQLIQEAGRWCERYSSDVIHTIDQIRQNTDNLDDWSNSRYYSKGDGKEFIIFRVGFRQGGVHSTEAIAHSNPLEYRSIWEIRMTKKNMVEVALTRVA